ncbi:hypothetical protein [Flavobacterium sp. LM4]|uniref:hypothetical protein n=1 Tax=Flavobacterium sp. LM4 TaxID=1938609 RepID=UPI000994645D|nr:hypothetical protein [Flavobacterium sp. LM4]OOV18566.1 hypothetical protein BXU10_02345 [Flavobacterium sp. LM4]
MSERIIFTFEIILIDFFAAYGLITILYLILSIFTKNQLIKQVDEQSNRSISFVGIIYLIVWMIATITDLNSIDEESKASLLSRMFGEYWFTVWLQPFLWFSITQLLRFKVIRKNILLRLVFSILLILSIERIVIIITSFHRDYLPSSWSMYSSIYPSNIFIKLPMRISFFLAFVGFFVFINRKINGWKSKKN